jgi:hypothetical protein
LLLSLFGVSLITPALAADFDEKLPACCRREGLHHCAMTGTPAPAGASIQAVCPAYPKSGATPAHSKIAGARLAQVAAQIPSYSADPTRIQP